MELILYRYCLEI